MSNCKKNSDKIRLLSSCQKPVYTNLCNVDELAAAVSGTDNSALLTEIRDAVINNTAVLKAELDELDLSIQGVIATIDDGIAVTATQAGTWTIDVGNTGVLATDIANALNNLNVIINGQVAPLSVNIDTQPITVTVANPMDLSATNTLLTQILNKADIEKDDYEYLILYDQQPDTTTTENKTIHGIIGDITFQVNQWTAFPVTWQNTNGTPVGSFTFVSALGQHLHNTYTGGSGNTGNTFGARKDSSHAPAIGSINGTVSFSNASSPDFFVPNGVSSVELFTGTGLGTGDAHFTNVHISATADVTTTTQGACVPFIRVLKDNTVVGSLDLIGNPYTVTGTVQVSCGEPSVSVSNLDAIEAKLDSLINKQTNATNYKEVTDGTTVSTVSGSNIVVTFYEGAGTFTLNGTTPVNLDASKQYRSEPMDGTVVVTPGTGAKYHVSWRA